MTRNKSYKVTGYWQSVTGSQIGAEWSEDYYGEFEVASPQEAVESAIAEYKNSYPVEMADVSLVGLPILPDGSTGKTVCFEHEDADAFAMTFVATEIA
jgi:hypothetical protein